MIKFRLRGRQHKHDKKQASHKNKAFTLVELIVVVVILAILIGAAIKGLRSYVTTSKRNTDVSNAATMEKAMTSLAYDDELCEFLEGKPLGESYTVTWKKPSDIDWGTFPEEIKNKILEVVNNELPESQSKKGFTLTATNTTTGLDVTISAGTTAVENPIEIAQGNTGGTGTGTGSGTGTGGTGSGTGNNNTSGGTNNTGNGAQAPTKPDDTVEDNTGDLEYITPSGVVEYYGDGSKNQEVGAYFNLMRVNMKNVEKQASFSIQNNEYGNTYDSVLSILQSWIVDNNGISSGLISPANGNNNIVYNIEAIDEDLTCLFRLSGGNTGSPGIKNLKFFINDELYTLKDMVAYGYIKPNVHIASGNKDYYCFKDVLNIYDGGNTSDTCYSSMAWCFTLNKGVKIDEIRFDTYGWYNYNYKDGLYIYTIPASQMPVRIKKVTS